MAKIPKGLLKRLEKLKFAKLWKHTSDQKQLQLNNKHDYLDADEPQETKKQNEQITRFKPTSFEKYAVVIAEHLINNKLALVNLSALKGVIRQRLIDFLSGATYCLGGQFVKQSKHEYLIRPSMLIDQDSYESNHFNAKKRRFHDHNIIARGSRKKSQLRNRRNSSDSQSDQDPAIEKFDEPLVF